MGELDDNAFSLDQIMDGEFDTARFPRSWRTPKKHAAFERQRMLPEQILFFPEFFNLIDDSLARGFGETQQSLSAHRDAVKIYLSIGRCAYLIDARLDVPDTSRSRKKDLIVGRGPLHVGLGWFSAIFIIIIIIG